MIVPQSRLLLWFALVAVPFAALGGVFPSAALLSMVVIAAMILVMMVDLLLGMHVMEDLDVQLPGLIRFSKDREGAICVRLHNPSLKKRLIRLGMVFPEAIDVAQDEQWVLIPADTEWTALSWRCRPWQRGKYIVTQARLEGLTPCKFWGIRKSARVECEMRVYPNLLSERKNLAALFLHRGMLGVHAQRQLGKGREFEKLRDYVPGDSYEDIHWKATARRGHPVTKVFQIERTQEIYVVIDASRLSGRRLPPIAGNSGAPGETGDNFAGARHEPETILERYLTAALVLGLAAEQQGDLFGLMVFSDRLEHFVRARNGKAHYGVCRDAIYQVQPRVVTPDYDEMASFIRLRLRRRAMLVMLTALDDPVLAESFVRNSDLLCHQHLMLVNMIKPPGADPLFSDDHVSTTDDLYQRLGGHVQYHNLREIEKVLRHRGIQFSTLENERLCVDVVTQYLNVKRRQML